MKRTTPVRAHSRLRRLPSCVAAFLRRWFHKPAVLERCLDRKAFGGRPQARRPVVNQRPALLALETREGPQLFLLSALGAMGAVGVPLFVAAQRSQAHEAQ